MDSRSDKIEVMISDKVDKVIIFFQSFLPKYQIGLETSIEVSDFIFDYVYLMHCKCQKINPSRGGSYVNSLEWIKNKLKQKNLHKLALIEIIANAFNMF